MKLLVMVVIAFSLFLVPVKAQEYLTVFGGSGHIVGVNPVTSDILYDGGIALSLGSKGTALSVETIHYGDTELYLVGISQKLFTFVGINLYVTAQTGSTNQIEVFQLEPPCNCPLPRMFKSYWVESMALTFTKSLKNGWGIGPSVRFEHYGPFYGVSESLIVSKTFKTKRRG